jgi:hypothetical protein
VRFTKPCAPILGFRPAALRRNGATGRVLKSRGTRPANNKGMDMNGEEALALLRARGLKFELEGNHLRAFPIESISPESLEVLKANGNAIASAISREQNLVAALRPHLPLLEAVDDTTLLALCRYVVGQAAHEAKAALALSATVKGSSND